AEVVNADDVSVCDLSRQQQLLPEAALHATGRSRIGHHIGTDHLQRHDDGQLFIPDLINHAHTAGAEHAQNAVSRSERVALRNLTNGRGGVTRRKRYVWQVRFVERRTRSLAHRAASAGCETVVAAVRTNHLGLLRLINYVSIGALS